MSTYMEREKFLKFGYWEKPQWLELDLGVKDEVVPNWVYFTGQQENYCRKIIKKSNIKFFLKDIFFSRKYLSCLVEKCKYNDETFDPKKCKKCKNFFLNLYWLHRHIYWGHMKPLNCPFLSTSATLVMGVFEPDLVGHVSFAKPTMQHPVKS